MNKNLIKLFSKLMNEPDTLKEFNAQKDFDNLYKFSLSIVEGYGKEEFKNFLKCIEEASLNEDNIQEIPQEDLNAVAGGVRLSNSRKIQTLILSSLLAAGGTACFEGLSSNNTSNAYSSQSNISINQNDNTSKKKSNHNSKDYNSTHKLSNLQKTAKNFSNDNTNELNDNNVNSSNENSENNENENSSSRSEASILIFPKASTITYGQSLSESLLSGGKADVPGSFAWIDPKTTPSAGEHTFSVRFIPNDNNIPSKIIKVKLNVQKAVPIITKKPFASSATFGVRLSSIPLQSGKANVNGSFAWKDGDEVLNAGYYHKNVLFIPKDNKNYEKITLRIPVEIKKAPTDVKNYPYISSITYGQPLSAAQILNLKMSTSGTVEWASPNTKLTAGIHTCSIIFKPYSRNYEGKTIDVSVTVNKAVPSLSKSNISQTYEPNKVVGNLPLPKGWRWQNPYMRLDEPGRFEAIAIYDETENYSYRSETVVINITKAEPKVPSYNMVYNQTSRLKDIHLPAGWHWIDDNEIPVTSKKFYKASFNAYEAGTPFYYSKSSVDVPVSVQQATPHISIWAKQYTEIPFGTDLTSVPLSGGISEVAGTFKLARPFTNLPAGEHMCTVIFTPADPNYSSVESYIQIRISKNMTPQPAPVFPNAKRTNNSISFDTSNLSDPVEFSKDGGITWQSSPVFSNLAPNAPYYFKVRYKETDSRCAGYASDAVCVSTKSLRSDAPAAPVLDSCTRHTITLKPDNRLEFSVDNGETWQSDPTFTNLNRKTDYQIVSRYKETDDFMPSKQSKALTVTTKRFPRPLSWFFG